MKRLVLYITITIVFLINGSAQKLNNGTDFTVSFSPSQFLATDNVTMTITINGNLQTLWGTTNVYLWMWLEGVKSLDSDWGNSSEDFKMTQQGDNVYTFSFVPSELYGVAPANLRQISFLIKKKDGSKQSNDITVDVKPAELIERIGRIFPEKVGANDVMTVYFKQELLTNPIQKNYKGDILIHIIPNDRLTEIKSYKMGITDASSYQEAEITFIPTKIFPNISLDYIQYYFEFVETQETITQKPEEPYYKTEFVSTK